jgi:hypothetical protein
MNLAPSHSESSSYLSPQLGNFGVSDSLVKGINELNQGSQSQSAHSVIEQNIAPTLAELLANAAIAPPVTQYPALSPQDVIALNRYAESLKDEEKQKQAIEMATDKLTSSIRKNVINLSDSRKDEIFTDFEGAVQRRELWYLADTILNWAFGGRGYDYVGAVANLSDMSVRAPKIGEPGYEEWQEFKNRKRKK